MTMKELAECRIEWWTLNNWRRKNSSSNDAAQDEINNILRNINCRVTSTHNSILTASYTESEIIRAVFQLHPSKAPGNDGFSAPFIQSCWHIIKDHFISDCLSFLNDGILSDASNVTLITLIPKQKAAMRVTDYRPISLIGVQEKNGLIDNIRIAQEMSHYINNINRQKSVYGSLKLDSTKAFDKISLCFLQQILLKLGFDNNWVTTVMRLVTSVKYSIRINDSFTDFIIPKQDIKSAYKVAEMLYSKSYCNEGQQSNDSNLRTFWKQLWKFLIPRKIKIFVWRGYLEGLPTGAQLNDGIYKDFAGLADVLYYCYTAYSHDSLCKILIAMWFCWYNRNLVVHGNNSISPLVASTSLLEGMKLASLLRLDNVLFEVDSKEIALNITYGLKKRI
ncbi:hypothetical protein QQ045_003422 [Rhodiola kirilowii]